MVSFILKINSRRTTSYWTICVLFVNKKNAIKHMFLQCSSVITFWHEFYSWWTKNTNENINLADSERLYGLIQPYKYQQVLSLALVITKYFIYRCTLAQEPLLFSLFDLQFHENIFIERYIAIKNKSAKVFNDKWHPFILKNVYSIHLTCTLLPLPPPYSTL